MDEVGPRKKAGRRGGWSSSNPNFALFCLLSQLAKLGEDGVGKEGREGRKEVSKYWLRLSRGSAVDMTTNVQTKLTG